MTEHIPTPPATGFEFIKALLDAGVVTRGERVKRVVIDAAADGFVALYVERFADKRILEIVTPELRSQITMRVSADETEPSR